MYLVCEFNYFLKSIYFQIWSVNICFVWKLFVYFFQTEANLASKCDLTKIFNLSNIFALPDTLLKPKNYCTSMPKMFWKLTIFVKWEVFNWIRNLNYIFKWNLGSSCDIRHTHTNTQRKKKEGSFHFLFFFFG